MSASKVPSLFRHARGELAQDALLAWLAEWAHPALKEQDQALHQAGARWVRTVLGEPDLEIKEVEAWCQVGRGRDRPDVLIRALDTAGRSFAAVVEHKVHANASAEQLLRYRERGTDLPGIGDVEDRRFRLAFLKTGLLTQAERRAMEAQSWAVLDRETLLRILEPAARASTNAILQDFHRHLSDIEAQCTAWMGRDPATFSGAGSLEWQGMLDEICKQLRARGINDAGHGLVNPPTGTFAAMWWGWHPVGDWELYLQAHAHEGKGARVGVRVQSPGQTVKLPASIRHHWRDEIVRSSAERNLGFQRVGRLGSGKTVAVAERTAAWWVNVAGGGIDLEATVEQLHGLTVWLHSLRAP